FYPEVGVLAKNDTGVKTARLGPILLVKAGEGKPGVAFGAGFAGGGLGDGIAVNAGQGLDQGFILPIEVMAVNKAALVVLPDGLVEDVHRKSFLCTDFGHPAAADDGIHLVAAPAVIGAEDEFSQLFGL